MTVKPISEFPNCPRFGFPENSGMELDDIRAGLAKKGKSKGGLAKALGRSNQVVTELLKGTREIKARELPIIRAYLDLDESVPIKGYVGASAEVAFYDTEDPVRVPAPSSEAKNMAGLDIRGESLGAYYEGWILFYDEARKRANKAAHGKLALIGLSDGRVLVRKIEASRLKNRFHLIAANGPPMLDIPIEWTAEVMELRRKQT
jgi:hypothetical protein